MKILYIYQMSKYGKLNKVVWEDIKITRDEGKIVDKRNATYNLSHGIYKYKENIDKVIECGDLWVEYISFDLKEITPEIKALLIEPFITKYKNEQKKLQEKINMWENMKTE